MMTNEKYKRCNDKDESSDAQSTDAEESVVASGIWAFLPAQSRKHYMKDGRSSVEGRPRMAATFKSAFLVIELIIIIMI